MKTQAVVAAMLGGASIAVSGGTLAEQSAPAFYVGGDLGKADFGTDKNDFYRLSAGYRFSRRFAAEISRSDFGDLVGGVEATSWDLVGVGAIPLADRLSAYGKLGITRIKLGHRDDETELTFGFGAQYDLTQRFGMRAEWQRYSTDAEIDVLTVGIIWKF